MQPQIPNNPYVTITRRETLSDGSLVYFAFHPDLPGCMSDGETPDEARAHLAEAREVYLQHLRENDLPIPVPTPMFVNPIPARTLEQVEAVQEEGCWPIADFVLA